jgi:hypothetical protein
MRRRTYHLYAKGDAAYEIVPSGWSFLAAALGPFWAIANGVFARYIVWVVALIPVALLAGLLPAPFSAPLFCAYYIGTLVVYVPLRAFSWREGVLRRRGYERLASIMARSSRDALRAYAASVPDRAVEVVPTANQSRPGN